MDIPLRPRIRVGHRYRRLLRGTGFSCGDIESNDDSNGAELSSGFCNSENPDGNWHDSFRPSQVFHAKTEHASGTSPHEL